jgi:hypothetical protein
MNDLEHEIRDTLRRHEDDAPAFEISQARHTAGRARRRQIRNAVVGAIVGVAAVFVAFAGLGQIARADRSPTVINRPSPSMVSEACGTPSTVGGSPLPLPPSTSAEPGPDAEILGWPSTTRNGPGRYSWDGPGPVGDSTHLEGFMHNGYSHGPGEVAIWIFGPGGRPVVPGRLTPHSGTCAIVAGHEATYRRFVGKRTDNLSPYVIDRNDSGEEWIVDIRGTTVVITLLADPRTPEVELAEAHEVIDSMFVDPQDDELGFRLIFTLTTDTWDSG